MTPYEQEQARKLIERFFDGFDYFPAMDMPAPKENAHHLKLMAAALVADIQKPSPEATLATFGHLKNAARLRHELLQKEAARGAHPTV